jgi:lipopolysaccharide cholinephosphotransferase
MHTNFNETNAPEKQINICGDLPEELLKIPVGQNYLLNEVLNKFSVKLALYNELIVDDLYAREIKKPFAYTKQCVVDTLYNILESMDNIFTKLEIGYMLNGGTQLGATRHKGLIPWDDDADIMILGKQDEKKFLSSIDEFKKKNLDVFALVVKTKNNCEFLCYQICECGGTIREGSSVPYPTVDIFIMKESSDNQVQFADIHANRIFKNTSFPKVAWDSRKRISFGHLNLFGFSDQFAVSFLDDLYGKSWNSIAVTNSIDHEAIVLTGTRKLNMSPDMYLPALSSSHCKKFN